MPNFEGRLNASEALAKDLKRCPNLLTCHPLPIFVELANLGPRTRCATHQEQIDNMPRQNASELIFHTEFNVHHTFFLCCELSASWAVALA